MCCFTEKKKNTVGGHRTGTPVFFQAKRTVNQPDDIYEKEANAVADKLIQQDNITTNTFFKPASIQRKPNIKKSPGTDPGTENYINNLSGGKPLDNKERSFFESKLGYDFSNVRIHNDSSAHQSAQNINALAYTSGNNIVFASNQFQPNTTEGKKLLAHELTHVVQQSSEGSSSPIVQREMNKDPSELSDDVLQSEYDAYNEYVHTIQPEDYPAEEGNMEYFNALESELKKRCLKSSPVQPTEVGQTLIDRITGKYAKVDGDPGEGLFLTPYVASEGQCTIGYGHVIFPKSSCTINTETTDDGKTKKTCACAPPWNAITKDRAIEILKQDMQTHMNEVHKKIKVNLNQAEFDAMVDLSAHVGSLPSDFVSFVNDNWCTNKEAVRNKYLRTAITMKDPDSKQYKVMKNFVERRKKRAW